MLYPFGWIKSLHIVDAPVFKSDQKINFANVNVILGHNGVGKTAICEWLSVLKDSSTLERWGAYPPADSRRRHHDLKLRIDVNAPTRHCVEVEISAGQTTFIVDDQKVPFSPIGYEVSSLHRDNRRLAGSDQADIAKCLRMDEISVRALADYINDSPGIFLKGTEWQKQDGAEPTWSLICLLLDGHKRPFSAISGGESGAVLFDFAIARAKLLAMHRPTLLIVETGGLSMSEGFLSLFLERLSAPEVPFQSVIVTTELVDSALWRGWQVIRLNRPPGTPLGTSEQITEIVVGEMHRHQPA